MMNAKAKPQLLYRSKARQRSEGAAMFIVAVTAYAMARDEQAAYAAGCNAFVSKPIDTRALGELVLKLLGETRS